MSKDIDIAERIKKSQRMRDSGYAPNECENCYDVDWCIETTDGSLCEVCYKDYEAEQTDYKRYKEWVKGGRK